MRIKKHLKILDSIIRDLGKSNERTDMLVCMGLQAVIGAYYRGKVEEIIAAVAPAIKAEYDKEHPQEK